MKYLKHKFILILVNVLLLTCYLRSYVLNKDLREQVIQQADHIKQLRSSFSHAHEDYSDNFALKAVESNSEMELCLTYQHQDNEFLSFIGYSHLNPDAHLQKFNPVNKKWTSQLKPCGVGLNIYPLLRSEIIWKQHIPFEPGLYRYAIILGRSIQADRNSYDYIAPIYKLHTETFKINSDGKLIHFAKRGKVEQE